MLLKVYQARFLGKMITEEDKQWKKRGIRILIYPLVLIRDSKTSLCSPAFRTQSSHSPAYRVLTSSVQTSNDKVIIAVQKEFQFLRNSLTLSCKSCIMRGVRQPAE